MCDGENAFVAKFLALLRAHAGQQTEVVLLNRNLPAARLKFTLGAVPVQNQIRRRWAGKQCREFLNPFPHVARQCRGLHLLRGVVIAVDDFAEADLTSDHLGEDKRIKRQQQFFVLAELVGEDETDGDELGGLAPAFGGHPFHGMDIGSSIPTNRQLPPR